MSQCKHSLEFVSGPFTWSETYVDLENNTPGDARAHQRANALAVARSYLLGTKAAIYAVRISVKGNRRFTSLVTNDGHADGLWTGPSGLFTTSASGANVDFIDTCLKVRYDIAGNNFGIRYHAGLPDAVFTGPRSYDLSQLDGGMASWNKWKRQIINNDWGMYGAVGFAHSINVPVTAITNDANGRLRLTTAAAFTPGTKFQLSGASFTLGDKINGTYTVALNAGGIITTAELAALAPGTAYLNLGQVRQYSTSPNEYDDATVLGVGEHKRGTRGFGSPRGKRSRRSLQHG